MIRTDLCDLLGIQYPVFQGGMAWIADGRLAAAVSEGGGLGIVAAGNAPADYVRDQIRIAKDLTEKPIGLNIMLMSPFADEVAKVAVEESGIVGTVDPERFSVIYGTGIGGGMPEADGRGCQKPFRDRKDHLGKESGQRGFL